MHYIPYRTCIGSLLLMLMAGMVLLLPGCEEDHLSIPPQIFFTSDTGYMDHDTSLAVGDRIRVGVSATSSGSNITFFQVSFDNNTESWKKAVVYDALPWISVIDNSYPNSVTAGNYNVTTIPVNYLINKDQSDILAKNLTPDQLIERLEELY